jgi:hypothetical protein
VEKHVVTWSYWLGLASTAITLVTRALNAIGIALPQPLVQGQTLWYMSFYKGALLFFLVAIATASYTWTRGQKSQ